MKKLLLACFLSAGLAFISPAFTSVSGLTGASVSAEESTTPAPKPSGWQQDAAGWYYLQNDMRLTGWQDLEGNRYYFNENGYRVSGACKIDGKRYLFRPESESEDPGALCRNISGLISFESEPDICYYLTSPKKGILASGKWVKIDDGYYYANAKGEIKLGTIKVKKKLYHITRDGRMQFYGKSSYDNGYYYANAKGVLKTGFQTVNKKLYYFDLKTGKRASGTVKIDDSTYYFGKNGAIKTGWVKKSGGTKVYYYKKNGKRASGWCTIKNKKYYFDPKKNDVRVQNCWKKISKKYYYFNASGVLQTNFFTVNGKLYYTGADGSRKKGWQTVNGRKYYINPSTYIVQTGWLKYNKKKYYLNPNKSASNYATAVTGWANISTKNGKKKYWYYFDNDGAMHTGWLTLDNKRYYFNQSNGRMFTGKHTIAGQVYNFGANGGINITLTGAWRIEVNRKSCFIVVYRGDTEVNAFVCSTAADGVSTPTGTFYLLDKLRWHELNGPSWGQYCSHITSDILFHSVPNSNPNDNHSLKASEYNKLGSRASGGCIRLTVKHAKYLFDNCPIGTKVIISDSVARPKYVPIEQAPKIPLTQNYDPTDPNI